MLESEYHKTKQSAETPDWSSNHGPNHYTEGNLFAHWNQCSVDYHLPPIRRTIVRVGDKSRQRREIRCNTFKRVPKLKLTLDLSTICLYTKQN